MATHHTRSVTAAEQARVVDTHEGIMPEVIVEEDDRRSNVESERNSVVLDRDEGHLNVRESHYGEQVFYERAPRLTVRDFIEEGKEMGLEKEDLRQYVEDRKKEEDVKEEKEEAKMMKAREEERKVREEERKVREEERKERERMIERNEKENEKERQFRLDELRLQIGSGNSNNNSSQDRPTPKHDEGFVPKIPYFQDSDDLESYLFQFEQYATNLKWEKGNWAFRLSTLLKGKARMIYSKLKPDDAADYDKLKRILLESFQLTAESYRERFRKTNKASTDSYRDHVTKLETYLDRWIDLSGKGNNVNDLKDLFLQEQILENLPADLLVHVSERRPESADEIVEIATIYEQARGRKKAFVPNFATSRARTRAPDRKGNSKENQDRSKNADSHNTPRSETGRKVVCYSCKCEGHFSSVCPQRRQNKVNLAVHEETEPEFAASVSEKLCPSCQSKKFPETTRVKVEGKIVNAFRDSGCTSIIVDESLVPKAKYTDEVKETTYANKSFKEKLPVAVVHIDSPYFKGETEVTVMKNAVHPVLIGKRYGVGSKRHETPLFPVRDPAWYDEEEFASPVTTRAQAQKEGKKTENPVIKKLQDEDFSVDSEKLKEEQKKDSTLAKLRQLAEQKVQKGSVIFEYKKDVLYRTYVDKQGRRFSQLVVPKKLRERVLKTAHDSPMAGHQGQKKTRERVWQEFFWSGMTGDIRRYCSSCDICQKTSPKGRVKRIPMGHTPIIDTAFKRVAVDIVGPIKPMSESKKQYVLVMIDYGTRYPEAVAIPDIKATTVAEALWEMWTRLGIPEEILTDQGSQFTSSLMHEVNELLKIKSLTTTPWHPQTNGLVEKFNGTLKTMLRKLAVEQPREWDKFIPALLFAYREVPQESIGFSPFEMLYARSVRGPMSVLRHAWTEEESNEEMKTTAEYVCDLRNRIEETCKIASENLKKASARQAKYYNRHAKKREVSVGKKVLLLLPTKHNKLELSWQGPFVVEDKINSFDYKIKMGQRSKIFHINLLKEYIERESAFLQSSSEETQQTGNDEEGDPDFVAIVIEESSSEQGHTFTTTEPEDIPLLQTVRTETHHDVNYSPKITEKMKREASALFEEASENFTDIPLTTNLETCSIKVSDKKPVFVKPRPVPHAMTGVVEQEIDEMLRLGVIEPASSPYNSPIVLVKKKDGKSVRFCSDLRELNKTVIFDAEPITDVEHLFASLSKAKYFSKLDLTKGYWAVPIDEEDRDKTAFTTSKGQFRWVNMPFGLKTAGSVFNRMMRKLLLPLKRDDIHHFMDDILIATETWEAHLSALRAVIQRLKEANLAAKPSKCFIGFDHIPYLGHEIGNGKRWPEDEKITKIINAKPPTTKKELRAFLGLTGFYRQYVQDYSSIAAPLSDKTKKHEPEKVKWDESCQTAFTKLKESLCRKPVLCMPNHSLDYILRTDASDRGIGAVLMQDQGRGLQPIAYASKKLNDAENNYATVEKECYATVWGIRKFERFLYGKHFFLETDHQPLRHLQRLKPNNPRLLRWALQLQPFSFSIRVIPGKDNLGADYLSRSL